MKLNYESLRPFSGITRLAGLGILLLSACSPSRAEVHNERVMNTNSIVAGPGERSFTQKYHVSISLPMSEASFLAVMKQLKLDCDVVGERGTKRTIPAPRHSSSVDLSRIKRVYQVYGGVDHRRRVGEMYRAYEDIENRVVYIENNFSYTGP